MRKSFAEDFCECRPSRSSTHSQSRAAECEQKGVDRQYVSSTGDSVIPLIFIYKYPNLNLAAKEDMTLPPSATGTNAVSRSLAYWQSHSKSLG